MDALRLSHHASSQGLDARRKCCREHHGLMTLNGELIDLSQIIREAQIKHAIGLINHQELHVLEFDVH